MVLISKYSLLRDIELMIPYIAPDGWEKVDRSDLISIINRHDTYVVEDDEVDRFPSEQKEQNDGKWKEGWREHK